MRKTLYRKFTLILISFSLFFTSGMSFAYWASQVFGNSNQNTGDIQLGQWPWGTPIYTINDFVTAVTTNQETPQDYFLANDLDFNNVMPGNWIENNEILFKGTLDGNGKTLYNVSLTARRGIIGVLDGGTVKNLTIHNANVTYNTSQSTTTGILVGRIQGTGALIENVIITNSSVSSNVLSGGLAGLIQPATGGSPGTVTINNVSITGTTVSGAGSHADYGNGGLVGTINNMSVSMNNVTAQTNTTSTGTASAGGLVGALRETASISIETASIYNATIQSSQASTTTGTGGAIGRLVGTGNVLIGITVSGTTVTSGNSPAGGLIGNADQTGGSLFITNTTLASTQVNSALNNATFGNGGVIGTLSGYALTMNQVSASANVTNSSASNAGGIIGYVASGTIQIQNTSVSSVNLQTPTTSSPTLGTGGVVGYLRGGNHTIANATITNLSISGGSPAGGLIGHANQTGANLTINDAHLSSSTVTSSLNSTTLGNGGAIGVLTGYSLSMASVFSNVNVTSSTTTNAGGIIGYVTNGAVLNLQEVTTSAAAIQINSSSNASLGSGGIIGYLTGTGHQLSGLSVVNSSITSGSPTGGLIGYANQASGTLSIVDANLVSNQVTSSLNSTILGSGGVIGVLTGYSLTANAITSNTYVTNNSTAHAGGMIGFVSNTASITLQQIVINAITIQVQTASNTSLGAGGMIGYLAGDASSIHQSSVNYVTITGGSSLGGLIGYAIRTGSTLSITYSEVSNTQLSGNINNASRGNGGVIGVLTGYSLTMNNVTSHTQVTNTAASSAGGVIGYVTNDATINLQQVTTNLSTVQINTASTGRGAGGMIGYLTGTGHQLSNITVHGTSITSGSPSGGLIGYAIQSSLSSLSITHSMVIDTTITSSLNSTSLGNGGVIGVLTNYDLTMTHIFTNVNLTNSSTTSAGGVIGFVAATSRISLTSITNENSTIITQSASSTSLGTGGIIGQLRGGPHVITEASVIQFVSESGSISGGVIGYANQTDQTLSITQSSVINSSLTSGLNNTSKGTGGLIGTLTGYSLTLQTITVQVNILNTAGANAGGVIGDVTASAAINAQHILVNASSVVIEGTGTGLGAGGMIGYLRGSGHQITLVRISNTSVSSRSASGGLVGFTNNGSTTYTNIKITGGSILSLISSATVGTGGLIGSTASYSHTMNDLYIETIIQTENANVGGIIGYAPNGNTAIINRAVIVSDVRIINPQSSTTIGAGGVIGRSRASVSSIQAIDILYSGKMRAHLTLSPAKPYLGTLQGVTNNISGSNHYSAELFYYVDSDNPELFVDTQILYDNMRGQSAGWSNHSVYLTDFVWSNLSDIMNSPFWYFDSIRNLYILID